MLLQVHDELVFEVPKSEAEAGAARDLIKKTMENAAHLSVPLTVEVGTGENWDAAH
jgi:DNA polymerase-1